MRSMVWRSFLPVYLLRDVVFMDAFEQLTFTGHHRLERVSVGGCGRSHAASIAEPTPCKAVLRDTPAAAA